MQDLAGDCGNLAKAWSARECSVFSGFVSNEVLVALYNLCSLFVLPSFHEGFGLPVLEAMACGAPAMHSNVTSLPEVVGYDDALFDPYEPAEIAAKWNRLACDEFREKLRDHGLERSKQFTWERTARVGWRRWKSQVKKATWQRLPALDWFCAQNLRWLTFRRFRRRRAAFPIIARSFCRNWPGSMKSK